MNESTPLAVIHEAVLEFLRDRDDAVLQGAQAVNAYIAEPRMTQVVDILALHAEQFAESLREHLASRFRIAVRTRVIGEGAGFRLYQLQQNKNRHLVDIRNVETLPENQTISRIRVLTPVGLITSKAVSCHNRQGRPKGFSDLRDLAVLLLAFPALKTPDGLVAERLAVFDDPALMSTWRDIVARPIALDADEDEFYH